MDKGTPPPAPASSPRQELPSSSGAETSGITPEFLAEIGLQPGPTVKPRVDGDEGDDAPTGKPEDAETPRPKAKAKDKGKDAVQADADTSHDDDPVQAEIKRAEAEALKQAEGAGDDDDDDTEATDEEKAATPKWAEKRLKKNAEQKKELREQLKTRETELAAERTKAADAEARLVEKFTAAPSGPLAHLDTPEKLKTAAEQAAGFMRWETTRPDFEKYYQDDPDTVPENLRRTAEQKCQDDKADQLRVLTHHAEQAEILNKRSATRETLKKEKPELFNPAHEAGKDRLDLYASDPRTRADFDQLIADAQRGRLIREEEASKTALYHRIDLKKARENGAKGANGHANGNGNGNGSKDKLTLPPISSQHRAPVKSPDAPDARAAVTRKISTPGTRIPLEEMSDALA